LRCLLFFSCHGTDLTFPPTLFWGRRGRERIPRTRCLESGSSVWHVGGGSSRFSYISPCINKIDMYRIPDVNRHIDLFHVVCLRTHVDTSLFFRRAESQNDDAWEAEVLFCTWVGAPIFTYLCIWQCALNERTTHPNLLSGGLPASWYRTGAPACCSNLLQDLHTALPQALTCSEAASALATFSSS